MAEKTLKFNIDVESDRATTDVNLFNKSLKNTGKDAEKSSKSIINFKNAIKAMLGVLAVHNLIKLSKSFIDVASSVEQYRLRLEILLGSAQKANQVFKDMSTFAGKVSFTYDEIMEAATRLSGVLKGGVDDINKWIPRISDIAATYNITIADTTNQIIRMYSAGAQNAEIFKEKAVLEMLGFKTGVSYNVKETRKILEETFTKSTLKISGAAVKLGKTWDGLLSMMADKWFKFRDELMKYGAFDVIKDAVQKLDDKFSELIESGKAKEYGEIIGNTFGVLVKPIEFIIKHMKILGPLMNGVLYTVFGLVSILGGLIIMKVGGFFKGIGLELKKTTLEIQKQQVELKKLKDLYGGVRPSQLPTLEDFHGKTLIEVNKEIIKNQKQLNTYNLIWAKTKNVANSTLNTIIAGFKALGTAMKYAIMGAGIGLLIWSLKKLYDGFKKVFDHIKKSDEWEEFSKNVKEIRKNLSDMFDILMENSGLIPTLMEHIVELSKKIKEFTASDDFKTWAENNFDFVIESVKAMLLTFEILFSTVGKLTGGLIEFYAWTKKQEYEAPAGIGANVRSKAQIDFEIEQQKKLLKLYEDVDKYRKGIPSDLTISQKLQTGIGVDLLKNIPSPEEIKDKIKDLTKELEKQTEEYQNAIMLGLSGKTIKETVDKAVNALDKLRNSLNRFDVEEGDFTPLTQEFWDKLDEIKFTPIDWKKFDSDLKKADEKLKELLDKLADTVEQAQIDISDYIISNRPEWDKFFPSQETIDAFETKSKIAIQNINNELKKNLAIEGITIQQRLILQQDATNKIIEINKNMNKELYSGWQDLNEGLSDTFSSAFKRMLEGEGATFQNFLDSMSDMFNNFVTDLVKAEIFKPLFDQLIAGLRGDLVPFTFEGELAHGQQRAPEFMGKYGPQIMKSIGAGAIGFGAGQMAGQTGVGGGLGAGIGFAVSGPVGSVVGGLLGIATEGILSAFKKRKAPVEKSITVFWDVLEGQIKELTVTATEDIPTIEVRNIQQSLTLFTQSILDFANQISAITGEKLVSFSSTIKQISENFNQEALESSTIVLILTELSDSYSKLFKGFIESYNDLIKTTFESVMPLYQVHPEEIEVSFDKWKRGLLEYADLTIGSVTEFNNIMNDAIDFYKVKIGASEKGAGYVLLTAEEYANIDANKVREIANIYKTTEEKLAALLEFKKSDWTETEKQQWEELFKSINEMMVSFRQTMADTIGGAFRDSLETGKFKDFEQNLRNSLYSQILDSLTQMFSSELSGSLVNALLPTLSMVQTYIREGTGVLGGEPRTVSIENVISSFSSGIGEVSKSIKELQEGGVFDVYTSAIEELYKAIGANTKSVDDNTDVIQKQIGSFLDELMYGKFAPAMSLDLIQKQQEDLFKRAAANQEEFQTYANFMTQYGLGVLQTTTTNYQDLIENIISQVKGLPYYEQDEEIPKLQTGGFVKSEGLAHLHPAEVVVPAGQMPSAEDIGKSVAKNLAPMLKEVIKVLKDSDKDVKIEIDGSKLVFSAVRKNTNIRQEIKSIAKAA